MQGIHLHAVLVSDGTSISLTLTGDDKFPSAGTWDLRMVSVTHEVLGQTKLASCYGGSKSGSSDYFGQWLIASNSLYDLQYRRDNTETDSPEGAHDAANTHYFPCLLHCTTVLLVLIAEPIECD